MIEALASISIAARATLNMHSLNNEGGEGNQIQTRMVDIIDHLGELHTVNAISGDMLKHVLMEHFYRQARAQQVTLCQGCQQFDTNRINADKTFLGSASKKDFEFINQVLQTCALDDIAGFLTTEGRSTPRKSVVDFGWVLGLPGKVSTKSYFHAKYASERGAEKRSEDADNQKTGANLGQSIFHRPASSGIYAIVSHLELARIGYNDIKHIYPIDEAERQKRASLLLESMLYTFIELNGAMRSTQLPHLVALEGFITTSNAVVPAPMVSPLFGGGDEDRDEDRYAYREQAKGIVKALNGSKEERVHLYPFDSISEFAALMRTLIDSSTPLSLSVK